MSSLIVVVALFGLAVGSFLNVVIHRVPAGMSLSRPGSHCPVCEHQIRNRHNIPVVSWLVLLGKCADCRARISVRYPVVELLTAAIFIALVVRIAGEHELATLPAVLYFAAMGVCLSVIDLDVGRLPNAIVYPSYPVLAVLLAIAAFEQDDPAALLRAAVGAVALFLLYFAFAFLYPAGMGFGDVKLAGIIGGVLGFVSYPVLLVGALAAFLLGSIVGIVKIVRGRASGRSALAFGPFMIAGALLSLFIGSAITEFYSTVLLGA